MPRTKVAKNSKRNREAAQREEKIREYDSMLEESENFFSETALQNINDVEGEIKLLMQKTSSAVLQMKMGDLLEMNLEKFSDWNSSLISTSSGASQMSLAGLSLHHSTKTSNPNDEGYLTEDSTINTGGIVIGAHAYTRPFQMHNQRCTPGPLSSARVRRPRRSRSACGELVVPGSAVKQPTKKSEHMSRNQLRTPMSTATRAKAISADRSTTKTAQSSSSSSSSTVATFTSPTSAFMRWPKPGEMVMSITGSPVVAQVMPDKYANVNIPVRNGVLSLRPKKLNELEPNFLNSIDPETLKQIKTLHANLDLIVNMADKAERATKK